jgi:myo-inositol-hexaphosphate 3-phosphohydrolase
MVPFAVTAIKNMSMQKDDGIITVYDMNTRDNLKFYGSDKYWNMDLKDEFMGQTRNLWLNNFSSKRDGSIFKLAEKPSEEMAVMVSNATLF